MAIPTQFFSQHKCDDDHVHILVHEFDSEQEQQNSSSDIPKFYLVRKDKIWECPENGIIKPKAFKSISPEQYKSRVIQALKGTKPEYKIEVREEGEQLLMLSIKHQKKEAFLIGTAQLLCLKSSNDSNDSVLSNVVMPLIAEQAKKADQNSLENIELKTKVEDLEEMVSRAINNKKEHQQSLLQKFKEVLDEKKRELAFQHERAERAEARLAAGAAAAGAEGGSGGGSGPGGEDDDNEDSDSGEEREHPPPVQSAQTQNKGKQNKLDNTKTKTSITTKSSLNEDPGYLAPIEGTQEQTQSDFLKSLDDDDGLPSQEPAAPAPLRRKRRRARAAAAAAGEEGEEDDEEPPPPPPPEPEPELTMGKAPSKEWLDDQKDEQKKKKKRQKRKADLYGTDSEDEDLMGDLS